MHRSNHKVQAWSILLVCLFLTTLSCNLSRLSREEASPVIVSTQSVSELVSNIQDAIATASAGGIATVVLTEQQLTSLAATELQQSGDATIQNLQIRLQNGLVKITGNVTEGGFPLRATIDLKINIDDQGRPHSEIVTAKVGPFTLPADMLNQLTSQMDRYLLDQTSSNGKQLVVKQITIDDGKMTIVGTLQ